MRRSSIITWDQLRVAALLVAAATVLGFAIYRLGTEAKLFSRRYRLVAFLPSANGLREGGTVTVAGQLAGSIRSVEFLPVDQDTTRNLRIVVEIDQALQQQVRGDSRVMLRTQGLLGDKFFDITPGTPRFRPLREGDTLQLGNAVDYEAMLQHASRAVTEIVGLTHDLRDVTGALVRGEGTAGQLLTNRALYDQLNATLTRAGTLLARLQNPNGSVGQLLDDPALYNNLTHMIASVDTIATQLHSGNGSAARLLRDDSLYTSLLGITTHADSLVSTLARGNGTASKLFTDSQLYDQLVQAVVHLNEILADLRKNPKRYTKGAIKLF